MEAGLYKRQTMMRKECIPALQIHVLGRGGQRPTLRPVAYLLSCVPILTAVSMPVLAINKCVGADNKVVYQDAPCMAGSKQIDTGITNNPELSQELDQRPAKPRAETAKVKLRDAYVAKTIAFKGTYVSFHLHPRWSNENNLPAGIRYRIQLLDNAKTILYSTNQQLDLAAQTRDETGRLFQSFKITRLGPGHHYAGGEFDHRRAVRVRVTYHLKDDESEMIVDNIAVVTEER
ncbi:hypothetical protein BURK2_00508 [Burkholderiales bacterium]|nr:hypothetical protein BURK2_00508 [Burkholderiales bacterium]